VNAVRAVVATPPGRAKTLARDGRTAGKSSRGSRSEVQPRQEAVSTGTARPPGDADA